MMRIGYLLIVGACFTAACAPVQGYAEPKAGNQACLVASQIFWRSNFTDEKTRYFQVERGRVFRLDAPSGCFSPSQTAVAAIEPYLGASNWMCSGEQVRVRLKVGEMPQTCIATLSGPISDPDELHRSGMGLNPTN